MKTKILSQHIKEVNDQLHVIIKTLFQLFPVHFNNLLYAFAYTLNFMVFDFKMN